MLNLIFDTNFICIRSVSLALKKTPSLFTREDGKSLFFKSVLNDIAVCIKYNNDNINTINFVFDSGTTWRSRIDLGEVGYKEGRKERLIEIDWDKLNMWMDEFKMFLETRCMFTYQKPYVEGDDFIHYLSAEFYNRGDSVIIFSGDGDIRQELKKSPANHVSIYDHHQRGYLTCTAIDMVKDCVNEDDMFNLMSGVTEENMVRRKIDNGREINPLEVLFIKVVSGDKSDKVPSAFIQHYPNSDHKKSFGEKRAMGLWESQYSDIDDTFFDVLHESDDARRKLASNILYYAKVSDLTKIKNIADNIKRNLNLVYIDDKSVPDDIREVIKNEMDEVLGNELLLDKFYTLVDDSGKFNIKSLYHKTPYDLDEVYA